MVLHITEERNALERCMMQFAFYDKETQPDAEKGGYRCNIHYNRDDETELLIRILSFGPVVRVLGPDIFIEQIQERIKNQVACMERAKEHSTDSFFPQRNLSN